MNTLTKIGVNAVAIWVAALLIPGISVSGSGGNASLVAQVVTVIVVGIIFGLVNAVLKPVVKIISLPVTLITLGLFTFIINALMLQITSWITGFTGLSFHIDSFFFDAILGAIVVAIVSTVLNVVLPDDK